MHESMKAIKLIKEINEIMINESNEINGFHT